MSGADHGFGGADKVSAELDPGAETGAEAELVDSAGEAAGANVAQFVGAGLGTGTGNFGTAAAAALEATTAGAVAGAGVGGDAASTAGAGVGVGGAAASAIGVGVEFVPAAESATPGDAGEDVAARIASVVTVIQLEPGTDRAAAEASVAAFVHPAGFRW
jgi:hypothetical protein